MNPEDANETSSELSFGPEATAIWHIKGWDTESKNDFKLLSLNSHCILNVVTGTEGLPPKENLGKARLRFYFRDDRKLDQIDDEGKNNWTLIYYLSLYAEELFNEGDRILQYDIKVDFLDEELNVVDTENSVKIDRVPFYCYPADSDMTSIPIKMVLLMEKFVKVKQLVWKDNSYASKGRILLPRPPDLRLKISVTPIYIASVTKTVGDTDTVKPEEVSSLSLALKSMFAAEENYADLNLETKDGMSLSAHKFILAARSPVLRELIEKEGKENNWNGRIKLDDVDVKPMGVVLHWIYTGELHENGEKCMEEVLDLAVKFKLNELIRMLDKIMISFCNKENMFFLYQIVKRNGLMTAAEDVSKYIKANI